MTPLERARRAVEQWNTHWAKSAAVNILLENIKHEIEETERDAYERAAVVAEELERYHDLSGGEPSIAIRALKGTP